MLEVIIEILITIIFEVILWGIVAYPGALVIWILRGRKESVKSILNKRLFTSMIYGILFWTLIIYGILQSI
jgi:hypothetical protein